MSKKRPGRVQLYGRSVKASDLKGKTASTGTTFKVPDKCIQSIKKKKNFVRCAAEARSP